MERGNVCENHSHVELVVLGGEMINTLISECLWWFWLDHTSGWWCHWKGRQQIYHDYRILMRTQASSQWLPSHPFSSYSSVVQLGDPHTQLYYLQPPVFSRHGQWLSHIQLYSEYPAESGETLVPAAPGRVNPTQPLTQPSCSSSSSFLSSSDPCLWRAVWAPTTRVADWSPSGKTLSWAFAIMATYGDHPFFSLPIDLTLASPSLWPPHPAVSGSLSSRVLTFLSPQAWERWGSHQGGCHLHLSPWTLEPRARQKSTLLGAEPADPQCHPDGSLYPGQGQPLCQWWVFMLNLYLQCSLLVLFYFLFKKSI